MTDLNDLVLDESYVLAISIEPYRLELRMDFVLAPEHAEYRSPVADEQECYRRGVIRVAGFRELVWRASGLRPSTDATGETDYGNLDRMEVNDGLVTFVGDWGEIEVVDGRLGLSFDD